MNKYNRTLVAMIGASSVLLAGCSEDGFEAYEVTGVSSVTSNPGTISQKHFSLLADEPSPSVIDPSTGAFTKTSVELTINIGDRDNRTITDPHTVTFVSEYGLIDPPSCDTKPDGTCSVTWTAISRPDPDGPGSDLNVTITAYAFGEEAFTDTNGTGVFDDGDAGFEDLEEPYVDADDFDSDDIPDLDLGGGDDIFTPGDTVIDVVSINDPSGANGEHDIADGFFNGTGCTHSSLCSVRPVIMIWDDIILKINGGGT